MSKKLVVAALRYWAVAAVGLAVWGILDGGFSFLAKPQPWLICLLGMCVRLSLVWDDCKNDPRR